MESPLPFVFLDRLQNTRFFGGTFDTFWGRFMKKRPCIFQACAGCILSITTPNYVNALCLSCLMLDQATSHIISGPGVWLVWLKTSWQNNYWILDFCRDMKPLPAFYNELRGQNILYIATLLKNTHGDWAHPLALTLWCQLLTQFLTDGRTDSEKKGTFSEKNVLWFGTGPKLDGYFRTLDAFFPYFRDAVRTALGTKKVRLKFEGKKAFAQTLHVCIVWANLPRNICHQNWAMHPHVCNWVLRPNLLRAKWKSKARPRIKARKIETRGIKHKREPMLWKSFLLRFQSSKTKITPATMSFKLAMWRISWFPQLQPTSMSDHHQHARNRI